jgi:D-xylose transport system substrate-binding protein
MTTVAARVATVLVLGAVLSLATGALGSSARSSKQTVTILLPNSTDLRWEQDALIFTHELGRTDPSAEWIVVNAGGREATQIDQAEEAVRGGSQVLVVAPVDPQAAAGIVAYAHPRGVKVIAYDRPIDAAHLDLYAGYDPVATGRMIGKYVVSEVHRGNLIVIKGPIDDDIAREENRGLNTALAKPISAGQYTLTLQSWELAWSTPQAMRSTESGLILVGAGGRVAAIVTESDVLAAGAIRALAKPGLHSIVTGAGSSLNGLRAVLDGTQSMTAFQPGVREATATADAVANILEGRPVPKVFHNRFTVSGGAHRFRVRAALFQPILVTRASLTQLLTLGYISRLSSAGPMNVSNLCKGLEQLCTHYLKS